MAAPVMVRLPRPGAASEITPPKVLLPARLMTRFVLTGPLLLPSTTLPAPDSPPMEGLAVRKFTWPAAATLSGPLPRAESLAAASVPAVTVVPPV